jgi:hypothetical protein
MTQFDMVTTQWAFVGGAIILPEKLGFGSPSGTIHLRFNKQHGYKIQEYLHQVSEQPT